MKYFCLYILLFYSINSFAKEAYYIVDYQESDKNVQMIFSSHTSSKQDNELKRLNRILKADVSERQIRHLTKQVETKLNNEKKALTLESFLVEQIRISHETLPFKAILGEFSLEKKDRYLLRIEVASFVRDRLKELLDLPSQNIDDFILLLTGEDVFPLLKNNFLSEIPLIATEKYDLQKEVGNSISRCKGMMATLGLSSTDSTRQLSKILTPYYRPHPDLFSQYLKDKADLKDQFLNNGLLRLRVGISSKEEVEDYINQCDSLFDSRRDDYVIQVIKRLEKGHYLLTRGIAHRWLLNI